MKVLAVIPARRGATRLRDKPLRLLGGEPLIVRVWQRLSGFGLAATIVVATDDLDVRLAVESAGGIAVMTRTDHPSGTDRVAEVASRPEFTGADVILNVQGDEPFVDELAVRGAVDLVVSGRTPIGTAAVPAGVEALASPDCVKVVCADDGRALYFSRARNSVPARGRRCTACVDPRILRQHLGIYAYTPTRCARG
ncbi:MAG: NTP transferase domain-containing protein [Gemmatimonadaceae bacterium]|nr:NTP transferase domain-containing protein [Gemmatimonadaceae bacterium]